VGGDQNVQHGAVLVAHPPQVVDLTVDLDEHLIEIPLIPSTAGFRANSGDLGSMVLTRS
jgi:hypothetical protein